MHRPIRFHPAILIVAILVLVIIAPFAWQRWFGPVGPIDNQQIVDFVDQGIDPEDMVIFEERIAELKAELEQKEALGERDVNLILRLGNAYSIIGEFKIASEYYLNILSTLPNDAPALENLGYARLQMRDYKGAETHWRNALAASPQEFTYFRIVDLIDKHFPERRAEIKPFLEAAIERIGQTPGLLVALGNWYKDNNMLDEAISHYDVASKLAPEDLAIKQELESLKQQRAKKALEEQRKTNK